MKTDFVVLEATGGLETPVASALAAAGIAVVIRPLKSAWFTTCSNAPANR